MSESEFAKIASRLNAKMQDREAKCTCREDQKQRALCPVCDKEEFAKMKMESASCWETKTKHPFAPQEQKIMDLLVEAHNEYVTLPTVNEASSALWLNGIHSLQMILMHRVVRRDYPNNLK